MLSGCIILFAAYSTNAQDSDCSRPVIVKVYDTDSGRPVIGAIVGMDSSVTFTDENGLALFTVPGKSRYHVYVLAPSMEAVDKDMPVDHDTVYIEMEPRATSLDDVEIEGHAAPVHTANSVRSLSERQLLETQGTTLGNMLRNISGVTQVQTGSSISKPVVNGMHSNRLLVLNNGVRQEGQQWGFEHAPEIDPYLAKEVAVVKGAESVRYGTDAIGGVIIVNPEAIRYDGKLYTTLSTSLQSNGLGGSVSGEVSGSFKKLPELGFRVQLSDKILGNARTAQYYLDNTGVRAYNASAALGFRKEHFDAELFFSQYHTDLGILNAAHIGSLDDLKRIISVGRPFDDGSFSYKIAAPKQDIMHRLLKVNTHFHVNDFLHFNIIYALQYNHRREFDRRRGALNALPSLDIGIQTHTLDLFVDYYKNNWSVKSGVNWIYQNNRSNASTLSLPLIPDFIKNGMGLYSIVKRTVNSHRLELGFRADAQWLNALGYDKNGQLYGGNHVFTNIAGNIGWIWDMNNVFSFSSNVGTAFRPPSVNELYSTGLHHGSAQMEYGDSMLHTERSIKWMNGLKYEGIPGLSIEADIYYHYFPNYIFLNPTGEFYSSLRGAFPEFRYGETRAHFYGIDFHGNYSFWKRWDYDLKLSLIRAKNISDDTYLPLIPTDRWVQTITYSLGQWKVFNTAYAALSHEYVAGQKRYIAGSDFAAPPSAYQLLHLSLGTEVKWQKNVIHINLGIQNLTSRLYKDYMNRYRYFADDLGKNIYLNLQYKF